VSGFGLPGEEGARENPVGDLVIADLRGRGWRFSDEQIQFRNTVWIDLTPNLEMLLAHMKQKTRYNIRLAERKGVSIRSGGEEDLHALYRLYAETSVRDGFVIRDEGYYRTVWTTFLRSGMAQPLVAEVQGQIVAGVVLFHFAGRAWYFYGMSSSVHREKMPGYLLQWEAMQRAKALDCQTYDLWGAPDRFAEQDSMWGVYRFKLGLGGTVVRHIGAWDLPVRSGMYRLFTRILPGILGILRQRGKARTQQATL
jgi:lipid II:glycine glycyltransferase (peptidoglycan interpeptide bridge formation enzyme)